MTSEPEHFADIVLRHFPRLKEPHMVQPAAGVLPSADDHYRKICQLLDEADRSRHSLAEVHALVERVRGHRYAGEMALLLWPADGQQA
jgi:hypothetical protein